MQHIICPHPLLCTPSLTEIKRFPHNVKKILPWVGQGCMDCILEWCSCLTSSVVTQPSLSRYAIQNLAGSLFKCNFLDAGCGYWPPGQELSFPALRESRPSDNILLSRGSTGWATSWGTFLLSWNAGNFWDTSSQNPCRVGPSVEYRMYQANSRSLLMFSFLLRTT